MEAKQYKKLLTMTLEKLEQAEIQVMLQRYEIKTLKEQNAKLIHKDNIKKG